MIARRSEFEAFRRENADQHREVARKIEAVQREVLDRIEAVQGRVDRLARWVAGVLLTVAGAAVTTALGALGWAVAQLVARGGGAA